MKGGWLGPNTVMIVVVVVLVRGMLMMECRPRSLVLPRVKWVEGPVSKQVSGYLLLFQMVLLSSLFRGTEQATHTATPLFKRKPNTRVRWRFRPRSPPLCLRMMVPLSPCCGSMHRSSRRRRPAGSTHPTPTCGSMWRMRCRGAWVAPGPRPRYV